MQGLDDGGLFLRRYLGVHRVQAQFGGQGLGLGALVAGDHDHACDAQRAQALEGIAGIGAQGVAQGHHADGATPGFSLGGGADVEQGLALVLKTVDHRFVFGEGNTVVFFQEMSAADDDPLAVDFRGQAVGDQVIDLAVGDVLEVALLGGIYHRLRQRMAGVLFHRGHQGQQGVL